MVERFVYTEEAAGPIPAPSTTSLLAELCSAQHYFNSLLNYVVRVRCFFALLREGYATEGSALVTP